MAGLTSEAPAKHDEECGETCLKGDGIVRCSASSIQLVEEGGKEVISRGSIYQARRCSSAKGISHSQKGAVKQLTGVE